MADAIETVTQTPVRRGRPPRRREFDSRSVPQAAAERVLPPLEEPVERQAADVVLTETDKLTKEYAEALAFAEEPVTILLHPSSERNESALTDLVSVNGRLAEVFLYNRWIPMGYLPKGIDITVKRKVVERLAMARHMDVQTKYELLPGQDPINRIIQFSRVTNPFSVREDTNPKGHDWLKRLLAQRA